MLTIVYIYDGRGYGTVYQTVIATGNSGFTSEFKIISTIDYNNIYDFDFLGLKVGDDYYADYITNSCLPQKVFEFCESKDIIVTLDYDKNGCTSIPEINWFKDGELQPGNSSNTISVNIDDMYNNIELKAKAQFTNASSDDTNIKINKIKKDSLTKIINPTCSNSDDGIIKFDVNVVYIASLEHNGSDLSLDYKYNSSNEIYFDSLDAGTYYISYMSIVFNDNSETICDFVDTLKLEPDNVLNFTPAKTVIDLSKKEELTITNNSTLGGNYSWKIGGDSFINNETVFNYAFTFPGNYNITLSNINGDCSDTLTKQVTVIGTIPPEDKTPPEITISPQKINENYSINGLKFDENGSYSFLSNDTLHVTLSCKYVFPEDYYFKLENAKIEDENGISNKTIDVDTTIFDKNGYGTVIQTIDAKDNFNNTSKLVIIAKVSDSRPGVSISSMNIGGIEVPFNTVSYTLEDTVFEFCNIQEVNVKLLYSDNGCTGDTRIDWYVNDKAYKIDSDSISVDISNEPDEIELAAEGNFSNTNKQNKIKVKIRNSILDFSITPDTIYLNQNKVLTISNISTTNAHYFWEIGGMPFPNDSAQIHYAFESPGKYPIILTDDSGFCNDAISKTVTVTGSTSVDDYLVSSIKIGPNPFNDFLNIEFGKTSDYYIRIYGVDGRIYFTANVYAKNKILNDLSFLMPGVYVLNITSADKDPRIKDFKIVKLTDY